ncbi:nuclear transcription factor Y subunit gamma-like isoform X1 [Clytia hemisphaerica]|uniref:nuclear transcription factor Y subunit gamma-like isoform X1 n=1 Tax=Clytia hemisphaerica TaxID=252671 RepID=UPI0034D448CE
MSINNKGNKNTRHVPHQPASNHHSNTATTNYTADHVPHQPASNHHGNTATINYKADHVPYQPASNHHSNTATTNYKADHFAPIHQHNCGRANRSQLPEEIRHTKPHHHHAPYYHHKHHYHHDNVSHNVPLLKQHESSPSHHSNRYGELLSLIEDFGQELKPTYAGSKLAQERLKKGIMHARALVRECLAEVEKHAAPHQ